MTSNRLQLSNMAQPCIFRMSINLANTMTGQ